MPNVPPSSLRPNPGLVNLAVHSTQFPDAVRRDLIDSLRCGKVNHKFHYDSIKQAMKWMAVHRAYSPYQTDPACASVYEDAFEAAANWVETGTDVVGIGCGSGQKDIQLIDRLARRNLVVRYLPCDVSAALVLTAARAAAERLPGTPIAPLVCDFAAATDFPDAIGALLPGPQRRLITFFGMIPNFEPEAILNRLRETIRPGDLWLFSANLVPEPGGNLERVLPLYDNPPTRDWLLTLLLDLGFEREDGELVFRVEEHPSGSGHWRIAAYYRMRRARRIELAEGSTQFAAGSDIRLFYSYRYTRLQVSTLLQHYGFRVMENFVNASEEEGVFLCAPFTA